MGVRTTWICDGCDAERDATRNVTTDWKHITIGLDGFSGYPVGQHVNGERKYVMCPNCQRHLAEQANPLHWPRAVAAASPAEGDQS